MFVNSREAERNSEFSTVWHRAARRILAFGVGMSQVSEKERRLRDTVARGVDVHIVMVDPEWVLSHPEVSAIFDTFYNRERFGEKFRETHSRLTALALEVNREQGREGLRIHTYQSVVPQSVIVADPGTTNAFGFLELHTYRRPTDRIRTLLSGPDHSGLLLAQTLRSISNLADYDFTREHTDDAGLGLNPMFAFA